MSEYNRGLRAGIPIALGYLSVSFSFGLLAASFGLTWWEATLLSFLTVTSAGQFSAIQMMAAQASIVSLLVSQATINVRYSFMSLSLAQKTSASFRGLKRWLLSFFMTDEIFAVASAEREVTPVFFAGLSTLPWAGWTIGTALGGLAGEILPDSILSALGLALYGMFIAIIIPGVKKDHKILPVVLIALGLSLAFYWVPGLKELSSGLAISICAIVAAAIGAWLFPVKEGASHD